jgi:microcystin degradation protein MlrC
MSKSIRMAIAGIHIESSTLSPMRTRWEDFLALRGEEMLSRYPFLQTPEFSAITPVPLVHFRAIPGGTVRRACYEAMKQEILQGLASAGEIDALFFDIHGAMAVEDLDDAEADLLAAIRAQMGETIPITCSTDLHGNISEALVAGVDLITTYRTAPHVDWMETRERAVRLLLRWLRDRCTIYRARVGIPVLVSGEMSSTEAEPGRSLYAPLVNESERDGVWDASLWVGYAWADQLRSMACVCVTGTDADAVSQLAEEIAQRYWQARKEFSFGSPAGNAPHCLDEALRLNTNAIFLSDAGDNPTAGAVGDVTHTLQALIEHAAFDGRGEASAIFASIPDPDAIAVCRAAGISSPVKLNLGGKLDPLHGKELSITGRVFTLSDHDPIAGWQAVVKVGNVYVIITEHRKPFHQRADFLALDLDPLQHTVTVVKIGYLEPELKAMATHHFLVLSPGAVPPRIEKISYVKIKRPLYPFDQEFDWKPSIRLFTSLANPII